MGAVRAALDGELVVTDSILDATAQDRAALADEAGTGFGASLRIESSTVIGKVTADALALASNTLFLSAVAPADLPADWPGPVLARRRQEGCARFCYLPPRSRTPRRYQCVPATEGEDGRVRPWPASTRYGDPRYAQLPQATRPRFPRQRRRGRVASSTPLPLPRRPTCGALRRVRASGWRRVVYADETGPRSAPPPVRRDPPPRQGQHERRFTRPPSIPHGTLRVRMQQGKSAARATERAGPTSPATARDETLDALGRLGGPLPLASHARRRAPAAEKGTCWRAGRATRTRRNSCYRPALYVTVLVETSPGHSPASDINRSAAAGTPATPAVPGVEGPN